MDALCKPPAGQATTTDPTIKPFDYIGRKFGQLVVVSIVDIPPQLNLVKYRCQCDCGRYIRLTRNQLSNGRRSCGCAVKAVREKYKPTCYRHTRPNPRLSKIND